MHISPIASKISRSTSLLEASKRRENAGTIISDTYLHQVINIRQWALVTMLEQRSNSLN